MFSTLHWLRIIKFTSPYHKTEQKLLYQNISWYMVAGSVVIKQSTTLK